MNAAPGDAVGIESQRTALASFPRSGNTWLRYLIERATGATSGSVYDDRILPRGREGIVVKTHLCNRNEFDRAVHMVRDPFDAIESYFHWKRDVQGDASVAWSAHVTQAAAEWRDHTLHWLAAGSSQPTLLVRYEDLRAEPVRELKRVLEFLGCAVSAEACARAVEQSNLERMRELDPRLGSKFFRKGAVGEGRAAFSAEEAASVEGVLGELPAQLGYGGVRRLRPAFINSIPKAGTHLVAKALGLVPGIDPAFVHLVPAQVAAQPGEASLPIGIGLPREASARKVCEAIESLAPGRVALWHVPYSKAFHHLLSAFEVAMVLVVRDPRDVVVSHALHIVNTPQHRLHAWFQSLDESARIDAVTTGVRDRSTNAPLLESLAQRYAYLLAWRAYQATQLVRFEDLVGLRGGGSNERQRDTLRTLLEFLGAPADDDTIARITSQLFGDTVTFRRGRIGGWREHLSEPQVRRIEESCASVMRELGYECAATARS